MRKVLNISDLQTIFFLGIGGIGMSALARYFHQQNYRVSGYDKTPTQLTKELTQEGIPIVFNETDCDLTKETDLIIYTPAVPKSHPVYNMAEKLGIPLLKRAEVLGLLSRNHKTLAFSGTHGKTTTSTMAAHIMYHGKLGCSAFLGGISKNYETNLLLKPDSEWFVTEADEYDRSFHQLSPDIAIITAIDADHLDIYGDFSHLCQAFELFAGKINSGGSLVCKKTVLDKINVHSHYRYYTYGVADSDLDFYAANIRYQNARALFDLIHPHGVIRNISPGVPARVNIENSVAAAAGALLAGFSSEEVKSGLESFQGIRRRFEVQIESEDLVYIDDYAHHPEEIKALIESVRELYPNKEITGLFQPHLFTRTRDLADDFAESLSMLNHVMLLPIYPARELPIEGVSSEILADKIQNITCKIIKKENVSHHLTNFNKGIFLTIGAGDIDQLVTSIREQLLRKINPGL